jgi:hypothetical protein
VKDLWEWTWSFCCCHFHIFVLLAATTFLLHGDKFPFTKFLQWMSRSAKLTALSTFPLSTIASNSFMFHVNFIFSYIAFGLFAAISYQLARSLFSFFTFVKHRVGLSLGVGLQ